MESHTQTVATSTEETNQTADTTAFLEALIYLFYSVPQQHLSETTLPALDHLSRIFSSSITDFVSLNFPLLIEILLDLVGLMFIPAHFRFLLSLKYSPHTWHCCSHQRHIIM